MNFLNFGVLCENATVTGSGARSRFCRPSFELTLTYFFYERVWNSYVLGSRAIFFYFENHLDPKLLTPVLSRSLAHRALLLRRGVMEASGTGMEVIVLFLSFVFAKILSLPFAVTLLHFRHGLISK